MRAAQISLIIPTYEKPGALDQVLRGVQFQSEMPGEILLADDGSGPATLDVYNQWKKILPTPVRHLWQADYGFRKTMILNKSIAAAKGEYIVLLDGDCVPHARFVTDHARLAERKFWVQGRRCFVQEDAAPAFSADGTPILSWIFMGLINGGGKALRLPFPIVQRNTGQRGIIGCNMGIWRDDLVAINGFDEAFTGWGGEDSDLGSRLYNLGRQRKFVYGHAVVFHLDHPPLDRARFAAGQKRVAEAIESKKVRCERGLDQYLVAPPSA